MQYVPEAHQKIITEQIITLPRSNVWSGMGTGKTASVLNALVKLNDWPVLIVAPYRVAQSTWPDEVVKWKEFRHLKIVPILGTAAQRKAAMATPAQIYTINYENLKWLTEQLGGVCPYKIIIADESTRLKGHRLQQGTTRAKALSEIAIQCPRHVNLTGTPAPNGLIDLWGQNWFVDRGERLGLTFTSFKDRWFQQSFDGYGSRPLPYAQKEIEERMRDVTVSIDAADYFDLEAPIVNNIYVTLPPHARALYKSMEKEMFMRLETEDVVAFNAASRTIKCLQLANGAAYVGESNEEWEEIHDEKLKALESIVEESAGMPVLVAYHFKSDLARLRKAFPKGKYLDKNPQTLRDWNAGLIPILFAHPASAGHGLNMQYGSNIIAFFGHWWDMEQYLQILERIGPVRQKQAGFKRPVFIHHILAKDTMDEVVMERRETKKSVQDCLLTAMKKFVQQTP